MHRRGREMAQERRSDKHKLLKYKFRFFTKRLVLTVDFFFLRKKKNKQFPSNPTTPTVERMKHRTRFAAIPAGVKTYVGSFAVLSARLRKFVESFADVLKDIHNVSLFSMAMSTDSLYGKNTKDSIRT